MTLGRQQTNIVPKKLCFYLTVSENISVNQSLTLRVLRTRRLNEEAVEILANASGYQCTCLRRELVLKVRKSHKKSRVGNAA